MALFGVGMVGLCVWLLVCLFMYLFMLVTLSVYTVDYECEMVFCH